MIDLESKRKKFETIGKVAGLAVAGFFVAPIILVTIKGIIGLAVAAVIGLLLVNVGAPWFGDKLANWRLQAIKAEAAKNPVETLQNDYKLKSVALDERKTAIEQLNGKIRTFSDKVDGIKAKYGPKDASYAKLSADLQDLRRIHADRSLKWRNAHAQLLKYAESIERAKMIWEAGLAAAAAHESSGLSEDEFYQKLRAETAFDSIQNSYNEALASLDTSLMDEPAQPQETKEPKKAA